MNVSENVEKGMEQMNANAEQIRGASEAFGKFWAEQTRANLEAAMAWQKQTMELFGGMQSETSKLGNQERARLEAMTSEWQKQFETGAEQAAKMAKSMTEAGETLFRQNSEWMNEWMNGMMTMPAAKPAKKSTGSSK